MLTTLITPALVLASPVYNSILEWYTRYDISASFVSGRPSLLSREWISVPYHHYQQRIASAPASLALQCEERVAISRVLAADVSSLFASRAANTLNALDFDTQLLSLQQRLAAWYEVGDSRLLGAARRMRGGELELTTPGADNPWDPIDLCEGELFSLNYAVVRFWTVELVRLLRRRALSNCPLTREQYRCYNTNWPSSPTHLSPKRDVAKLSASAV